MIHCTFEDGAKAFLRHVVTDAIVIKDDKVLLVKRAPQLVAGDKWGLIGGYVDRDETLEETVRREVPEETGYSVKDVTFLTIRDNPQRDGSRQNVAVVYVCTADKKIGEPDWESSEVKWFNLNELPKEEEFAFDHYQILKDYNQSRYLK
jgi:ADP-ribose pyrophosphatase YjhB (NUDIX family)